MITNILYSHKDFHNVLLNRAQQRRSIDIDLCTLRTEQGNELSLGYALSPGTKTPCREGKNRLHLPFSSSERDKTGIHKQSEILNIAVDPAYGTMLPALCKLLLFVTEVDHRPYTISMMRNQPDSGNTETRNPGRRAETQAPLRNTLAGMKHYKGRVGEKPPSFCNSGSF